MLRDRVDELDVVTDRGHRLRAVPGHAASRAVAHSRAALADCHSIDR